MPYAAANGIELFYDTVGDPADPTILLVNGLGTQLISWRDELCEVLAGRGFQVVRFDNRDVGLSTHIDQPVEKGTVAAAARGDHPPAAPYVLDDMADDAIGLLDHLGVGAAHVVGVSMGGMIAQTLAIRHPARVLSLTSIMSTTGEPEVGTPAPRAFSELMAPPPDSREAAQEAAVRNARVWGSPGLYDEQEARALAAAAWDRDHDAAGTARQLLAIMASGSRAEALAQLTVPTLVIHGTADTLMQPSGGERTAELVPDATLLLVEGMGHDLARPLWPRIVDAIARHAHEHAAASS
ncbi:MAG: alpha/beta fold hydrolase [Acidimicrobiia bacterium]